MITFESDLPKLQAILDELAHKVTPSATSQALNSAAGNVKREAVKRASRATGIPAKTLRKRVVIPRGKKATVRYPVVTVWGGLWPIKVSKLTPKPRKLKRGAVKYKVLPGGAVDPGAFIATMPNGNTGVFKRKGTARLPIQTITVDVGPHVRRAIASYAVSTEAKKYFERIFFSQMDRKMRGALRRKGMTVT